MTEKIYTDLTLGTVRVRKSPRARRVSIRVHPVRGIVVTLPRWAPYATGLAFLAAKRDWALAAVRRQRARLEKMAAELPPAADQAGIAALVEQWRKTAKQELPPRLAELAGRYGFTYNRLAIKHNVSNWGSCSRRGNINLNLNLVRVPQPLRDYVMLHELSHLRHPDHGPQFHALLEELCQAELATSARSLEKGLKDYILL